jgi:hypothetical protein
MATAARKARKRSGIPFFKAPKVGTPIWERAAYWAPVQGAPSTKHQGTTVPRSRKKQAKMLEAHGITA